MFFVNAPSKEAGGKPGAKDFSGIKPSLCDGSWEEWLGRVTGSGELQILHINTSIKIKRRVSSRRMIKILESDFERCRFSGWKYSGIPLNGFRMYRVFNGGKGLCREEFRIKIIPGRGD